MRRSFVRAVRAVGGTFVALGILLASGACAEEKVALGEPCNRDVECHSNRCVSGICASEPPRIGPSPQPTTTAPTPTPDAGDDGASDASADAAGDGG